MNENELAEILESDSKNISGRFTYSSRYIADIATMLRQQQAEIEALKAHPVKELTDEEIEQVMVEAGYGEVHKFVNPFDFARAILRKAQEK